MPNKYVLPEEAAFLINPEAAVADRNTRLDLWFRAKQRQGHPICREAGNRLHDLEERITGHVRLVHVATEGDPDPTPPAAAVSEVEAARLRAEPAVHNAVAAYFARKAGGAA